MTSRTMTVREFQKEIWGNYRRNGRDFPWRHTKNPYHITVSEIMLQQTQTSRVVQKYKSFLVAFPDFEMLHKAPLVDVLKEWQGLGYNRRAVALKHIASKVINEYNGKLPQEQEILAIFPGIGTATAGAIRAFAFNRPAVFIETNIRRAFIDSFFAHRRRINDGEIMPLIEESLDRKNPREWYFALMDYGAMLGEKKRKHNPNKRSAHYKPQSRFIGSRRETRGNVVRLLLAEHCGISMLHLAKTLSLDQKEILGIITALCQEGIVIRRGQKVLIA